MSLKHKLEMNSGVNFTNLLQAALHAKIPKVQKRQSAQAVFFALSGSVRVKAVSKHKLEMNLDLTRYSRGIRSYYIMNRKYQS